MKNFRKYIKNSKYSIIIITIFSILSSIMTILAPIYIGKTIDSTIPFIKENLITEIRKLLLIYVILFISNLLLNKALIKFATKTSKAIRADLFEKTNRLTLKYLDKNPYGDTLNRFTVDVENVSNGLIQSISKIIMGIITVIISIIIMIKINKVMTVILICIAPIMYIISRFVGRNTTKLFSKRAEKISDINGYTEEALTGFKTIKNFNSEQSFENNFKNKNESLKNVTVNFNTLKLVYETSNLSKEEVEKIIQRIEPEVTLIENKKSKSKKIKKQSILPEIIRLIAGLVIALIGIYAPIQEGLGIAILIVGYLILLYRTVKNAIKLLISSKKINESLLITVSVVGAFLVGQKMEGLMVITLYEIGKILESKAVNKTRKSISELMDIRPEYANVKITEKECKQVSPEEVKIGDTIIIKQGEKVPIDGIVTKGSASLDTSSLTGESLLCHVREGDNVLSGSINEQGLLEVRVTKDYEDSTVNKILELVENATDKKAKTETFVNKASKIYTPIVLILAVLVAVFLPLINKGVTYSESIYRALIFLVISCPCAIAISVPLSYFSGIGKSSKSGILIKGSDYLDALKNIKEIAFDKTGTLTKGKFEIRKIDVYDKNYTKQDVLRYIVMGESFSNHPIAQSILKLTNIDFDKQKVEDFKEISGRGLSYKFEGNTILVGNKELVDYDKDKTEGTKIFLKINEIVVGAVNLADTIKEGTKDALDKLKEQDIKVRIFTGDNRRIANKIADELEVKNGSRNVTC